MAAHHQRQQRQRQRRQRHQRPPHRSVPRRLLAQPLSDVDAVVARHVADQDRRLAVVHPALVSPRCVGKVAEGPGRVVLHQLHHAIDQLLLAGPVIEQLELRVQAVELGVDVVGRVLAVGHALRVRAVEQEQEVLGVGVVGQPARPVDLVLALAHLVLELVVVGGADLQLHADLGELPDHPVELGLALGCGLAVEVVVQHQRPAAVGVAAVGVAGLYEQGFRVVDRAAHRGASLGAVRHRVQALGRAVARAEHPGRQRAHRSLATLGREDARELLPVDGDRQRLAQLAVLRLPHGGVALADHGVEHVEAQVPARQVDDLGQLEALLGVLAAHGVGVVHVDQVLDAVVGALDCRHVVVALAELGLQWHRLFLDREDQAVDEGRGLAAVGQQPGRAVFGHALAGVRHLAVVRVAHHHVAAVLHMLLHHVGPGADRPDIERQPVAGHAGLGVEGVGLPGHRRQESHRHPVLPLRVLAADADAQQVRLGRAGARQRPAAEVEEGLVRARRVEPAPELVVLGLDAFAVVLQPKHVLGKDAEDRRRDARRRVALERVDIVVGEQLTRALVLEVPGRAPRAQRARRQRVFAVVTVAALRVFRERRVRLVPDAGLDAHVVDALGDLVARRVLGQCLAVLVEVTRRRHRLGGLGHQLVGPQQIVVAVGRLVDLVGVGSLVVPVRGGRVQMPRRLFGEGRDQRVAGRHVVGQRVVVAAGGTEHQRSAQHQQRQEPPHRHHPSSALRRSTSSCTRRPTGSVTCVATWP